MNPLVLNRVAKFWIEGDEALMMYPIFDQELGRPFASATERARYIAGETDIMHPTWDGDTPPRRPTSRGWTNPPPNED